MVVPDFFSSFALIPIIESMYQEYSPHPVLSPYIDKYWEVKGSPEMGEKMIILPDGCTDFMFNLDDTRLFRGSDEDLLGVVGLCRISTRDRGQIHSLRVDCFHKKAFRGIEWAETSFEGRGISFS